MKTFITILLLLVAGCSQKPSPPMRPAVKAISPLHRYAPTFAAVIIPDSTLTRQSLPTYEDCTNQDACRKVAAYVLAHSSDTAEMSFMSSSGNTLPIVWNNKQTNVRIVPDSKQQERDLQIFGIMIKSFDLGVSVGEESDKGQVNCQCFYDCGIHLKQTIGGSTDHGIGGSIGGGLTPVGHPEIWPVYRVDGASVWMLVALDRG
jgi:hypothetical protein